MNEKPAVSIVVPNYNYSEYLRERIESLLRQTYQDFEIIILDDASTDNSREIIELYQGHAKVRTQFFDKNSGSTYARWNDGASLAKGRYILFAGADDNCEPDMLFHLVSELEKNPSAGVAYCDSWKIDKDGLKICRVSDKKPIVDNYTRNGSTTISGVDMIAAFLLKQRHIANASSALLRKDIFNAVGGFDCTYGLAADVSLWTKISKISDFIFVDKPLNYYRVHERSVTSNKRGFINLVELYRVCIEIKENSPLIKGKLLDLARRRYARKWAGMFFSGSKNGNALSINQHWIIYRNARVFDDLVSIRMLFYLIKLVFKKVSVLK